MRTSNDGRTIRAGLVGALVLTLGLAGCGDDDAAFPPLQGPSGLGLSIEMGAEPSFLNADGVSTSRITITARGPDGGPVSGKPLFCQHDGDGALFPAEASLGGLQTGISLATDGSGAARMLYRAGTLANLLVTIRCEPYSYDAGYTEVPRSVVIHQR